MEDSCIKKSDQLHQSKQKKVRFKLASSYSGRILKHVYEDGQELESPEEKYHYSFIDTKIPHHMDMDRFCSFGEMQEQYMDPPTGLIAQRINIYHGMSECRPLFHGDLPNEKNPVLDFGKIIIYTNNLKIIRSPNRKSEHIARCNHGQGGEGKVPPEQESKPKVKHKTKRSCKKEQSPTSNVQRNKSSTLGEKEMGDCEQCGGSGTNPCSLCHGSKLSMLANRFNESIRELRCPACNPHGLEQCQLCAC